MPRSSPPPAPASSGSPRSSKETGQGVACDESPRRRRRPSAAAPIATETARAAAAWRARSRRTWSRRLPIGASPPPQQVRPRRRGRRAPRAQAQAAAEPTTPPAAGAAPHRGPRESRTPRHRGRHLQVSRGCLCPGQPRQLAHGLRPADWRQRRASTWRTNTRGFCSVSLAAPPVKYSPSPRRRRPGDGTPQRPRRTRGSRVKSSEEQKAPALRPSRLVLPTRAPGTDWRHSRARHRGHARSDGRGPSPPRCPPERREGRAA